MSFWTEGEKSKKVSSPNRRELEWCFMQMDSSVAMLPQWQKLHILGYQIFEFF